jgi:hypothetical protein
VKFSDRPFGNLNQHFDKILFGVGFIYLIAVSGWLSSQNRLPWDWGNNAQSEISPEKIALSKDDAQFIAYLQQSLKTLRQSDSSPKGSSTVAIAPPQSPTSNILPLPIQIPPSQIPAAPTTPTVIERIYVPVYPPQSAQSPPVIYPPQPTLTTKIRLPNPPRSTASLSVPLAPPPKVSPQRAFIPPLVTNKTSYTLVGVLESGDRSSALFTENGLTQRIQVGERVGSSNWILTAIENQKAILSDQGKTRYLEVGQKF